MNGGSIICQIVAFEFITENKEEEEVEERKEQETKINLV